MHAIRFPLPLVLLAVLAPAVRAQYVGSETKISKTAGGFGGNLKSSDFFGDALAALGDVDLDGVDDLAVGARGTTSGTGALWTVLLNSDGTVKSSVRIADGRGGFVGTLDPRDWFSSAIAGLGDLDGDGVVDVACAARGDDDGGPNRGAIWILFLAANGSVAREQKISATTGGFAGALDDDDEFGSSLANVGDLDGDGITDLAVGARKDDDGGTDRGALWILFLNADGTVKSHAKISATSGDFGGVLGDGDQFGGALAALGAAGSADVNGDGIVDLAVGARTDPDGGINTGAVWTLFLDTNGTVKGEQKISASSGNFRGAEVGSRFGSAVASLGDLNGDGTAELAVGAEQYRSHGAVWILYLAPNGSVRREWRIDDESGGFSGTLESQEFFGVALAALGDLDGDGFVDLSVGASGDDDGAANAGAVWTLFLFDGGKHRPVRSTVLPYVGTILTLASAPLTSNDEAFLGTRWTATLDCGGLAPGTADLVGALAASSGTLVPAGELLVAAPFVFALDASHSGGEVAFTVALPADPSLAGLRVFVQGRCADRSTARLSNGLRLTLR